jgi:hypothetical protein
VRIATIVLATSLLTPAAPAVAWKGERAPGVRAIAEVNARAESGDYVSVEGEITEMRTGSGSRWVVTLEDSTGSVLVRVPEHLLRSLNQGRDPEVGRRVRVSGKWDHASLDDEIWGIHAQAAERVE